MPKKLNPGPKVVSSPKHLREFTPVGRVIRRNSYIEAAAMKALESNTTESKDISCNEVELEDKKDICTSFSNSLQIQRSSSGAALCKKEKVLTKSRFFEETPQEAKNQIEHEFTECEGSVLFCVCGKICAKNSSMCEDCLASCKVVEAAGYLYVKRDESNLDRLWFQLVNTDLYCIHFQIKYF